MLGAAYAVIIVICIFFDIRNNNYMLTVTTTIAMAAAIILVAVIGYIIWGINWVLVWFTTETRIGHAYIRGYTKFSNWLDTTVSTILAIPINALAFLLKNAIPIAIGYIVMHFIIKYW